MLQILKTFLGGTFHGKPIFQCSYMGFVGSFFAQFLQYAFHPDFIEFIYGHRKIHQSISKSKTSGQGSQERTVVQANFHRQIQAVKRVGIQVYEFNLLIQTARSHNVCIALIKFAKTSFLRTICTPNRLNLVPLKRKCQFSVVLRHVASKGNRQIVTKRFVRNLRSFWRLAFRNRFQKISGLQNFKDQPISFFPVLAHQRVQIFERRGFQRPKTVQLKCLAQKIHHIPALGQVCSVKISGAFGR